MFENLDMAGGMFQEEMDALMPEVPDYHPSQPLNSAGQPGNSPPADFWAPAEGENAAQGAEGRVGEDEGLAEELGQGQEVSETKVLNIGNGCIIQCIGHTV